MRSRLVGLIIFLGDKIIRITIKHSPAQGASEDLLDYLFRNVLPSPHYKVVLLIHDAEVKLIEFFVDFSKFLG